MLDCARLTLHCCRFVLNNVLQLNPLQQAGNKDGRYKTKSREDRTELKIDIRNVLRSGICDRHVKWLSRPSAWNTAHAN